MNVFETVMMLCFLAAWPFSIHKSYTSRSNAGKSLFYMLTLLLGYICGILFVVTTHPGTIIYLYIAGMCMVLIDLGLYIRNN